MEAIDFYRYEYKDITKRYLNACEEIGGLKYRIEILTEENQRLQEQLNKPKANYPFHKCNMKVIK